MNEYMTLSETSEYIGKSKETLRRWDKEGKLLAVREPMSNYRVYRKSEIDTLFAEGQRRYVESLSSYARQFMGRMKKPKVDYIEGLCPAVAIEQKVNTRNPRSTVATSTEIYDYIKLLFSRAGHTISPVSGREVKRETT